LAQGFWQKHKAMKDAAVKHLGALALAAAP